MYSKSQVILDILCSIDVKYLKCVLIILNTLNNKSRTYHRGTIRPILSRKYNVLSVRIVYKNKKM